MFLLRIFYSNYSRHPHIFQDRSSGSQSHSAPTYVGNRSSQKNFSVWISEPFNFRTFYLSKTNFFSGRKLVFPLGIRYNISLYITEFEKRTTSLKSTILKSGQNYTSDATPQLKLGSLRRHCLDVRGSCFDSVRFTDSRSGQAKWQHLESEPLPGWSTKRRKCLRETPLEQCASEKTHRSADLRTFSKRFVGQNS